MISRVLTETFRVVVRLFTHHFGWKLLSVAVAFLLWLGVVGEPEQSVAITIPIEYKNIPPELEISSDVPDKVRIEVRGHSRRMNPAGLANSAAVINLAPAQRPGERTFTIEESNLELPAGVTMSRAVPSHIRVRLEHRMARDVPVRIKFEQPPDPQFRIKREEVKPPVLRILGPESRVKQVMFAETDPIDIREIAGSASFQVQTFVGDPQVRIDGAGAVTVEIEIERIPASEQKTAVIRNGRN